MKDSFHCFVNHTFFYYEYLLKDNVFQICHVTMTPHPNTLLKQKPLQSAPWTPEAATWVDNRPPSPPLMAGLLGLTRWGGSTAGLGVSALCLLHPTLTASLTHLHSSQFHFCSAHHLITFSRTSVLPRQNGFTFSVTSLYLLTFTKIRLYPVALKNHKRALPFPNTCFFCILCTT